MSCSVPLSKGAAGTVGDGIGTVWHLLGAQCSEEKCISEVMSCSCQELPAFLLPRVGSNKTTAVVLLVAVVVFMSAL